MEVNSSLQFWKIEGPTFDEGDSSLGEPSPVLNPESVSIVYNLQVSMIYILDFFFKAISVSKLFDLFYAN